MRSLVLIRYIHSHSLVLFCWHIPSLHVCLDFYFRRIPTCQNANTTQQLSLFSFFVHAGGTSQSKRPEHMLCSSRFSSEKCFFFLKDHFFRKSFSCGSVCYHLSKKETKRELFKKYLWLILSVLPPLQLTTLYLGQTHSQKIGWD